MLDKKKAMEAYTQGKCTKLFSYNEDEVVKSGFIPGEWLKKHIDAATNPNKTFLVYNDKSIGLYEILD